MSASEQERAEQSQAKQVWSSLEEETRQEVVAEFHRVIKEMIDEHFRISATTSLESKSGDLCPPIDPQSSTHQQGEPADAVRVA